MENTGIDLCIGKSPCSHRRANLCTFRLREEVALETLAMSDPKNRTCYESMAGVLDKPCLEQEKKKHTLNGEVRNL